MEAISWYKRKISSIHNCLRVELSARLVVSSPVLHVIKLR